MIKFLREQDAGTLREIPVGSEVVYAKQVPPEYQESPFDETMFEPGEYWDGVCIYGNHEFEEVYSDLCGQIIRVFENGYDWDYDEEESAEYFREEFPTSEYHEYSEEELRTVWDNMRDWSDDPDGIAEILTILTGNVWDTARLTGTVQGEVQYCIYDTTRFSKKDFDYLEIEYFNTGSDFRIEIDGEYEVNVYCYSWNKEGMKEEIADAVGCSPEDVILDTYY